MFHCTHLEHPRLVPCQLCYKRYLKVFLVLSHNQKWSPVYLVWLWLSYRFQVGTHSINLRRRYWLVPKKLLKIRNIVRNTFSRILKGLNLTKTLILLVDVEAPYFQNAAQSSVVIPELPTFLLFPYFGINGLLEKSSRLIFLSVITKFPKLL